MNPIIGADPGDDSDFLDDRQLREEHHNNSYEDVPAAESMQIDIFGNEVPWRDAETP